MRGRRNVPVEKDIHTEEDIGEEDEALVTIIDERNEEEEEDVMYMSVDQLIYLNNVDAFMMKHEAPSPGQRDGTSLQAEKEEDKEEIRFILHNLL